ncbi:MAG: helix-turn-helix domain-containing protein [bacterium]
MQQADILIKNLGLTDKEAAVYMAILELGTSTIQPIATQSGIKRTSIYYFIDHLVELGLVEQAKIRNRKHYSALPPENMVSLQKQRLSELEEMLPEFKSFYNVSASKPRISYYEGTTQLQNILLEELKCKEVWYIWPTKLAVDMVGGPEFMQKLFRQLVDKKIKVKVIRFHDQEVHFPGSIGGGVEKIREIRYAKPGMTFPLAIGIYDSGKVGFLSSKKEGFGIMIESRELYDAMCLLFNIFWEQTDVVEGAEG